MKPNMEVDKNTASYEIKSLFRGQLLSYMVGFYVFAFYLELHLRLPILQTVRFQFSYGALIGIISLYKLINTSDRTHKLTPSTKSALLLILTLGFYTIFSMNREVSLIWYNDRVVKFSLIAFFIYSASEKVEDLRVILAFMMLAWLKIGLEGFLGWYTGSLVWENQGIPRLHGSTAMFGHPNSFSGFAVGCLPFSIFLLMCLKNNLFRVGLLTLILFSLIIVVNTGSRTGYVAVIIGTMYFFMKLKAGKAKVLLLALITISLTINLVPDHYKERFGSIFTGQEKEGKSSEARAQIVEDAIAVYLAHPFGVGVHAFPKVREEMFGRSQDTHNLYLEILTNTGPLGLILFIIFIANLFRQNKDNIKRLMNGTALSKLDACLLANLSKAVIGFLLLRIILGLFGMDLYEVYWWIALGLTLSINRLINSNISKTYEYQ